MFMPSQLHLTKLLTEANFTCQLDKLLFSFLPKSTIYLPWATGPLFFLALQHACVQMCDKIENLYGNVYGWLMCKKVLEMCSESTKFQMQYFIGNSLFAAASLIPVSSCSPSNVRDFMSNLKQDSK